MSLGRLSESFRDRREQRSLERATITIRRVPSSRTSPRFTGRVVIDSRHVGDLVGSDPRAFEVEPGEHTITVIFARRPVILWDRGRRLASTEVSLGAGEHAEFTCGIRPEVVRCWNKARNGVGLGILICYFLLALNYAIASVVAPYLREAIAFAVYRWQIPDSLIPLLYKLVRPFWLTFCLLMLSMWVSRRFIPQRRDATDEALTARFGSPYYVDRLVDDR